MPRNGHQVCGICRLSADERNAVEAHITAGMKLRDLEKIVGISKSALSRHSRKCMLRSRLASIKTKRIKNPQDFQIIVTGLHPGRPDLDGQRDPADRRPILEIHVEYEQIPI